jgi:hypothetical protein
MAKHKYIETPEALLELFNQYKEDLKEQSNSWTEWQYVGKDGNRVEDKLKVPMTMEGFRRFGYDNGVTVKHYFDNSNKAYEDYCTICSRISNEIRENQIIGGLLGKYNPSITQRLNGLKESVEQTNIEQPLFGDNTKPMD